MWLLGLFLAELGALFFISNRLTSVLYSLFYLVTKSKNASFALLTFLYLPGTVVHELAHLLVAEILRVPTGEISFTPQLDKDGEKEEFKLGEVKIGATDPLRRLLVGTAPLWFGLAVLLLLVWLFQYFWPQLKNLQQQILLVTTLGYLMFAVSNNMFSSKKDMEGAVYLLPVAILFIATLYLTGFRFSLTGQTLTATTILLASTAKTLGIVLAINVTILLVGRVVRRLFLKRNW